MPVVATLPLTQRVLAPRVQPSASDVPVATPILGAVRESVPASALMLKPPVIPELEVRDAVGVAPPVATICTNCVPPASAAVTSEIVAAFEAVPRFCTDRSLVNPVLADVTAMVLPAPVPNESVGVVSAMLVAAMPLGSVLLIDGAPPEDVTSTPLFAVARFPSEFALL